MASVFLLTAPPVIPPSRARRFPVRSQWIGWDGSVWDLHSGAQGVLLLQDVVGMHHPTFDRYTSSSRAVPGHRLRGTRPRARQVVWPLLVSGHTQEVWFTTDTGFWHALHPDLVGTWRVSVGAQVRELQLTLIPSDDGFQVDPYYNGWAKYVAELEAAQPYWTGETVERVFEIGPASPTDFFDAGGSPPFHITPGSTFATATITNPGDVAAYPVWTAVGPLNDIELGVGTVTIDVPFNLANGEVLRIDTDPRNQTATLDGDDVTEELGFQPLAAIDPGDDRELTVVATSTGTITCEIVPLYFRAF